MRWNHTERGAVPPSEFIPVAEDMGLIVQLGEWALRQRLHRSDGMAGRYPRLRQPFARCNSPRAIWFRLSSVPLASSGLSASRLELEITELVLLEKSERNISILNQLRELGVRISMDDFGTGYSSIGYFAVFRSTRSRLINRLCATFSIDEGSLAIVRAIAGLGVSFGMTTTAEGVETEEQMRCLNLEGCVEVQGYFFSKPVPTSEIARVLADIEQHRLGRP